MSGPASPSARKPIIAVCGSGTHDPSACDTAREVGRLIAERGAVLICGGLGGVMRAAAQGAKEAGGLTVGLLPGSDRNAANPFIDLALPTGLGHARNALITLSAWAIIALPGGPGTLSEIGLGLKMGKTVVGLGAWSRVEGVTPAATAAEAVEMALNALQ